MKAFEYATAHSVNSAQEMVADNGQYIAGGNDLLGLLKEYIVDPKILVSVKSLPGLDRVETGSKVWTIGTNVTVAQIEDHSAIRKTFPGLAQAAAEVGSQQIRNVATVGGNISQHSRCWYFRHRDVLCLKKEGDMCYARHGENKYHSLFTGNTCISPVVSNLAIAFAALDATAVVQRAGKPVRMSMAEFYAKAFENPTAHNSLNPGDLVLKVEIPTTRTHSAYMQTSEKHEFDWALVSCAAAANITNGKLSNARVALGSISPVPHQVDAANEYLEGKTLDEATVTHAADMILHGAKPHEHNGYKVPMAHALIRRTLLKLNA
ncbi:MAG: molybdopterin dehydrogenase FAD-binding [Pedosphaera sp.]|nr:molybdopterin dehydrogenase FAD-binding [Pedosphaera sp.]